jgi:hypothetical protein
MKEALIKALKDPRTVAWGKKARVPTDFVESAAYQKKLKDVLDIFKRNPKAVKKFFF